MSLREVTVLSHSTNREAQGLREVLKSAAEAAASIEVVESTEVAVAVGTEVATGTMVACNLLVVMHPTLLDKNDVIQSVF